MIPFQLPPWKTGDTWQVASELSHMEWGTFLVPVGPEDGPKRVTDRRVGRFEVAWNFEIIEAPENPDEPQKLLPGRILINQISAEVDGPFAGLGFRWVLKRWRDDAERLWVGLERIRELIPPTAPKSEDPDAERDYGEVTAVLYEGDPQRPSFDPDKRLGYLFDFPCLGEGMEATGDEDRSFSRLNGEDFDEQCSEIPGGVAFGWSFDYRAGPMIRSLLAWESGAPWYGRCVRERVIEFEGEEQRDAIASMELIQESE